MGWHIWLTASDNHLVSEIRIVLPFGFLAKDPYYQILVCFTAMT